MKTRRDEIRGLDWYARNPAHALDGMKNLTPEQYTVYGRALDQIYMTGDRLEDHDQRQAAVNNIDVRVYRRVKAELITLGKLFLEADGDTTYIRNERASQEVVKGLAIASAKAIGGALGGAISTRRRGQEPRKNNDTTPSIPSRSAQAPAQHPYSNKNLNLSDREESGAARAAVAAQPEGRATAPSQDLANHQESAVRAFAALIPADELGYWTAYKGTIDRLDKSWLVTTTTRANAGLIRDRFSGQLRAAFKNVTICAPNSPDITIT